MIEIGRLCVKIAGRDAGKKCVVVDTVDKNFVLIDGETRRRKCNAAHLEPTSQKLEIEKGASHEKVVAAFKAIDITIVDRKPKATNKPKAKPAPAKPVAKPAATVTKPTAPATKPAAKPVAKKPVAEAKTA